MFDSYWKLFSPEGAEYVAIPKERAASFLTELLESRSPGDEIKMLRINSGLTQEDLASRSGVSQTQISKIEKNKVTPRPSTIKKLKASIKLKSID